MKQLSERRMKTLRKRNLLRAYSNAIRKEHLTKNQTHKLKKEMLEDFK